MFLAFLKILGFTIGLAWCVLLLILQVFSVQAGLTELLIGCALPVFCFIPGFYAIAWSAHRPFRAFMIAVFGGMLIRLLCISTAFVVLAKFTDFHIPSLLFSLIGFYTLCLAIELYFVHHEVRYLKEKVS